MGKRILVTGGAGFIGSHLCNRLLQDGHSVTCLDNFYTGSRQNLAGLLAHPQFEVVRGDVTSPLNDAVDQIYNLACPASPVHYQRYPVETTRTSVLGALNVLDLALRRQARVLQASTSEVYGDPEHHPQREEDWGHVNPIGIRSCYDEGKRAAESLFFDYRRQFNTDIRVIRIFNTYGPHMHPQDGRVISNFIVQALAGHDLTLYGDGSQTRSFCYVDDLVEGMVRMMNQDDSDGPVNLGNPEEYTMLELAERIVRLTGSTARISFRPLPQDDPKRRKPDIARAEKLLDWQPSVPLEAGLIRTIAYFRERLAR
ncbi:MAG: UDP-glucuronic acid decarboxylase family protein [Bacillota bacterium]|nr:UDP-glucuronic acid decarboxylase family protein [Bacillota bacterium]